MNKYDVKEIYLKIRGKSFQSQFEEFNNIKSREELDRFQDKKLEDLLIHAAKNSGYYKNLLKNIDLENVTDEEVFRQIPVLTKDVIRSQLKDLVSVDAKTRGCFYNTSGGSTGEPLRFVQDQPYTQGANATNFYYYQNLLGVNGFAAKKVLLWGSERDLLIKHRNLFGKFANWVNNAKFLNSFKMKSEDMARYADTINSFKPEILRGYASSLYSFSKYLDQNDKKIYSPRYVVSTAEPLRNQMRDLIEKVMGTKVYNFYGSREIASLAGECHEGLLHYFPFYTKLEVLDDDNNPVKAGEEGKIVVTNLFNYSMPLIRYEIGDMGVLGPETCECGSFLPTLKSITGRITDQFTLEDGSQVPGEFFIHMIGRVCNRGYIKKFQIIQEDYDELRMMVVPDKEIPTKYIQKVNQKLKTVMGDDCVIEWDFVDDIPKTTSGKYLYTISRLDK
ncbi:MAG: phenylacetate--CoA ligase family protein [Methanobacterium sp.]